MRIDVLLFARIALISAVFAVSSTAGEESAARPSESCSLEVHIDGFRNGNGLIGGAVFKTTAGWPENDDMAFARNAVPVDGKSTAVLSFPNLPPGRYAVVVLHDENTNHRLDRNLFRMPKEGFGFANNPHVRLSAPSWQEASVEVICPSTSTNIHLIYK